MEECYNGISIPEGTVEPCNGDYKSTDCSLSPSAFTYLGLPENASQTQINNAIQASLMAKEELINEIDGSETKLSAGDNIVITGAGTFASPYLISATSSGSSNTFQNGLTENLGIVKLGGELTEEETIIGSVGGTKIQIDNYPDFVDILTRIQSPQNSIVKSEIEQYSGDGFSNTSLRTYSTTENTSFIDMFTNNVVGFEQANSTNSVSIQLPGSPLDNHVKIIQDIQNIAGEPIRSLAFQIGGLGLLLEARMPDVSNTLNGIKYIPLSVNNVFADANGNIVVAESPFTALDEGSGTGIRISSRNPANFGKIGDDAFDISYSSGASSTRGATGTGALAIGEDVIASGYGAYAMGYLIDNSAIYSLGVGLNSQLGGYAVNTFGVGHQVSGLAPFVVGQAAEIINDNLLDWNSFPEKILFAVGNGTIQNADTEYTVLTRSNALQVRMNGLAETPSADNAKIDAELTGKVLVTREWVEANGGTQDLQSVIDSGSFAEVDSGQSYVDILGGSPQNRIFNIGLYSTVGNNNSTEFYVDPYSINFYNSGTTKEGGMNVNSGEFYLYAKNKTLNLNTTLRFNVPIVDTTIYLPAKIIGGNHIVNTTPDTIYTVATLPTGVLNDMAIVSDATAPTYLGTLVGGGAVVCPVWHNGTNWVSR